MGHRVLNGLLPQGSRSVFSFSSSEFDDIWTEVELQAAELLRQIQPSRASEERRQAVINYVEQLIEREFNCKVYPFGSVPLKTYLPDGDIDLTAISELHRFNDTWANDVSAILEREERNKMSAFRVKEVKCVYAEVPVVKCLVENIIVDISFNQLGGLSTLCFLEAIDRLIGRDHLFKRSIILVKAWCFYESRILGAHHGLLSTYALEILVLYVFHVFDQSLRGPLEVLFRFLQIFSKFDWNQYCLSLLGPIPLASLHLMAVEPPQSPNDKFLFNEQYLTACREKYNTLLEGTHGKTFSQKFMNLVDPLRPFNNLGRSVNKGNFVRIYSAFAYGASQLEKLLQSPKERFSEGLASFFRNTQGHCRAHRLDASTRINAALCSCKSKTEDATCTQKLTGDVSTIQQDQENASNIDRASHCDNDHWKETDDGLLGLKSAREDGVTDDLQHKEVVFVANSTSPNHEAFSNDVESLGKADKKSSHRPLLNILKNGNQLAQAESTCTDVGNGLPSPLSEVRTCMSEEAHDQINDETDHRDEMRNGILNGEFPSHLHAPANRDADASILEGDYETHLNNLDSGRMYQNSHMPGNLPYLYNIYHPKHMQGGSVWEGPGRPLAMNLEHFPQGNPGRNGIPSVLSHIGSQSGYMVPNGLFQGGFTRHYKGTGTFFPNPKTKFQRDKYPLESGNRTLQRSAGSIDSPASAVQNGALAFRSKPNFPKKYDGLNKSRAKKSSEPKSGEGWESTDESVKGTMSYNSAAFSDLKNCDGKPHNITTVLPASKDLPLEQLEFGSFGPGFLAKGLHDVNINRDSQIIFQSQQPQFVHHDSSESTQAIPNSKAHVHPNRSISGVVVESMSKEEHHADQQQREQCSYQMKEEDFPPLAFFSQRESSNMFANQKNTPGSQRSYHEACLIGHSL